MLSSYLRPLIFRWITTKMKNIKKYKDLLFNFLEPIKGIILFLFLFVVFDFLWKIAVDFGEGDNERILLVFNKDFTAYTDAACLWTAQTTYWFVHNLLGYENFNRIGITLFFNSSIHVDVIWGCIGLKQFIMFFFIMCLYYGPWKHKRWYIPMSLFILVVVNILRQAIISIIIKDPFPEWFITFNEWRHGIVWENTQENYWRFYTDWFELFHRDLFTWLYYDGVIFVLWLIWEEKFNKPFQKLLGKKKSKEL